MSNKTDSKSKPKSKYKKKRPHGKYGVMDATRMLGITRETLRKYYMFYNDDRFKKPLNTPKLPEPTIINDKKYWTKSQVQQIGEFRDWLKTDGYGAVKEFEAYMKSKKTFKEIGVADYEQLSNKLFIDKIMKVVLMDGLARMVKAKYRKDNIKEITSEYRKNYYKKYGK